MKRARNPICRYQSLEDRRLLASFAFYPDNIRLQSFATDQVLSIFEQGDSIAFYLPEGDIWHGTDVPGSIEGNGTSQLNIHPDMFVGRSLHITDDTKTIDTVFASNLDLRLFLSGDSVSQSPDTSLNLTGGLFANSVALREPGNELDVSIHSTYVDVFSHQPIEIRDLVASYGGIRSTESLSVGTYDPSFSRLQVNVTVTLAAPILEINSARLGVTGRLNLYGRDSISFVSNNVNPDDGSVLGGPFIGHSELNQLNFQSLGDVRISIDESPGEFDYPRNGDVFLTGDNRAKNLSLDVGFKKLFDAPGTILIVQENAFLAATGTMYMADHPGNLLWIGKRAHLEAYSYFPFVAPGVPSGVEIFGNILISSAGDVRFGWLRSNDTTFITVVEDDSSYLARIGDASKRGSETATRRIEIHSPGDITIAPTGKLVSEYLILLYAEGEIKSADGMNQGIQTGVVELMGAEIDVDQLNLDQIKFTSTGDVSIQSDSNLYLRGENEGRHLSITVDGQLGNVGGASILASSLDLTADSIWLANATSDDRLQIDGHASFHTRGSREFAVIGREGRVWLGSVSFNVDRMELHESDYLFLVGNNNARILTLSSTDFIFDGHGTRLEVAGNTTFQTPGGVLLNDHESDVVSLCGHTVFDVNTVAMISAVGNSTLHTWKVLNGAIERVHYDVLC